MLKRLVSRTLILALLLSFQPIAVAKKNKAEKAKEKAAESQKYNKPKKPKGYPGQFWDSENIGDRNVAGKMNFFGLNKEMGLGARLAKEIEKHAKIIDDPTISEYVNRIGQNLVNNSDSKVPFTIKVIDNIDVNAFALPGGFFFVNSGLIMRTESEAELAGVMAHEIAHVAARHGTRQATKGQIASIASIPLIFMGGWAGFAIRQAANLAIPMTFLKFSRKYEEEADELGAQYLHQAGYDPTALSDFFEKLLSDQKRRPGTFAKIFSSHPPTGKRISRTQNILNFESVFPPQPQYVVNTSEFDLVKERLTKLNNQWRRKDKKYDDGKPTLRRSGSSGEVILPDDPSNPSEEGEEEEDEPPVLKRKSKTN